MKKKQIKSAEQIVSLKPVQYIHLLAPDSHYSRGRSMLMKKSQRMASAGKMYFTDRSGLKVLIRLSLG